MAVWEVTDIVHNGTDLTYAIRLKKEPEFSFKVTADPTKNRFAIRFPILGIGQREIMKKIFGKNERGKRFDIQKGETLEGDFKEEFSTLERLVGRYRVPFFL